MTDAERRYRHARSMALLDTSIRMGYVAIVVGIFGMAWWPLFVVATALLATSWFMSKRADKVSPYRTKEKA
jgi:hypothetical protein